SGRPCPRIWSLRLAEWIPPAASGRKPPPWLPPGNNRGVRVLALFLIGTIAWCADSFPVIEAENLLGAKISLPEAAKGHPTVLVIGFTHAAQKQTLPWNE